MTKRQKSDKLSFFTIGIKLGAIIIGTVFLSFIVIAVLMQKVFKPEFRKTGEAYNFEVNWHSAKEVEYIFSHIHANSRVFMQTISAAGAGTYLARQTEEFFFERNPDIAALCFTVPRRPDQVLINSRFFSRNIGEHTAESWFKNNDITMMRAAVGETILLNATPYFETPLLAMFFSLPNGSGGILFSPPESLSQSYLIDSEGSVFTNTPPKIIQDEGGIAKQSIISEIRESDEQNGRMEYTDEDEKVDYLVAFYKLDDYASIVITSIKKDRIQEQWKASIDIFLPLAITVFFILVWFTRFFPRIISIPIETLAVAAQKIEGGNFKIKLKHRWRDEIGALTVSFNKMSDALDKFGRFTNREIAFQAIRGEIKPGGLPKHATIFFSDIRGFTEKSENFTREFGTEASDKIVHWLNDYFTQMVECVHKTDGVVDKFIGDAVMAHWGTTYTSGNPARDAYKCIHAALMMRKSLYYMNKNRTKNDPGNPPINIGCGINTGWVTAGQIGSDQRMEYTVIGDPVNLASRAEGLNKPFCTDILITEDTWNLVKKHIIAEEMPPVRVKGKEKPVRLFAVINLAASPKGPRTLADVRRLLGLKTPDLSKVDVNAEEKKYKISGAK